MKQPLLTLAVVVTFSAATLSAVRAEQAAPKSLPVPALQAITRNARAAEEDARIYQWARVNREVDRIAADANKVEKALVSDPAFAKRLAAFQQAVSALRSARLAHDVDRLQDSARQLLSTAADLQK